MRPQVVLFSLAATVVLLGGTLALAWHLHDIFVDAGVLCGTVGVLLLFSHLIGQARSGPQVAAIARHRRTRKAPAFATLVAAPPQRLV